MLLPQPPSPQSVFFDSCYSTSNHIPHTTHNHLLAPSNDIPTPLSPSPLLLMADKRGEKKGSRTVGVGSAWRKSYKHLEILGRVEVRLDGGFCRGCHLFLTREVSIRFAMVVFGDDET
ncbi:hypothetical protein L1887_26530 [Cichorium endivia]|nr:hypothetical protein L1887_26530 [Cichorium endivia]